MDSVTLLSLGAGTVVFLIGVTAWSYLQPDRTAVDRLAGTSRGDGGGESPILGMAKQVARYSIATDVDEVAAVRKRLLQAGFRSRDAVERYSGVRTLATGIGALLCLFLGRNLPIQWTALVTLLGATAGYYGPSIYVTNKITNRQSDLMKGFPDALDLLVSCVEAGLGLDSAFRRVADEVEMASPDLALELQLVTHEVAAGIPRVEALKRLADRTGLDEVGSLVNVLVQAERFGTSVAKALRVHSEHVRTRRMQRAEAKAGAVSPKLTVVMILFILPCLMAILLGPAMIRVINLFAAKDRGTTTTEQQQ